MPSVCRGWLLGVCRIALIAGACGAMTPAWADWYFRGTPNGWGCTAMQDSGSGNFSARVRFNGEQAPARFKIDRTCDWRDSAPAQDFQVGDFASYDIRFNVATRQITLTPLAQDWSFRGTPNNWAATPMTRTPLGWEIKGVDFQGAGGCRFMCSWDTQPEDVDALAADVRIAVSS